MIDEKQVQKVIEDLYEIEGMCELLKQKAYSTRKKLEGVSTSANQKKAKSKSKKGNDLVSKFRLSLEKAKIKSNE